MNLSVELLDTHVAAGRGSRTAVIDGGRHTSYASLQAEARRMAAGIQAAGVVPGDRVLLALPNGRDLIAAWLAAQHVGAIGITIPHTLRPREVMAIVDDAEPRLTIASADFPAAGLLRASPESLSTTGAAAPNPHDAEPDAVAIIAYTAGLDGRPRGACHSAASLLASADRYGGEVLGLGPDDVVGGHPPLAFAYGLGALLVFPLRFGAATAPARAFDAESLGATIARERVTVFFGTATCYRLLLRMPGLTQRFDVRSLRCCVSAGEPLEAAVSDAWATSTGIELLDGLGTTELFHIVISQRRGRVVHGALGRPVPGYDIRVVDDAMCGVPVGCEGLLAVRGPTACRFWRRPDLQRDRVRGGWTLTGDIVVEDADGLFWFRRRADDIIVSAGYNIAPVEVAAVLEEHPAVARADVMAAEDPTRGALVAARVVLRPEAAASPDLALALQQHTQRELSSYKCPRRIEFVDGITTIRGPQPGRRC